MKELRGWLKTGTRQLVTAYHGTVNPIFGDFRIPTEGEKAVFFTDNASEAREWSSAYIYEAQLEVSRFSVVDWKSVHDPEGEFDGCGQAHVYDPETMAHILQAAIDARDDGVIIRDIQNFVGGRLTSTYAVLNLSCIDWFRRIVDPKTE